MIAHIASKRRLVRPAAGFTLVELLVTVTIIGILTSVALAALAGARQTARIAATRATITKLHELITRKYDSYLHRQVSWQIGPNAPTPLPPVTTAQVRLRVLREIMRMEMPDRYTDVTNPGSIDIGNDAPNKNDESLALTFTVTLPKGVTGPNGNTTVTASLQRTTLARAYFRQYMQGQPQGRPSELHASAELLYLMVSHMGKDAMGLFNDSEIGDADNDGWPEFKDAWGNPIYFLRWTPGFNDSRLQANVVPTNAIGVGVDASELWDNDSTVQTRKSEAAANDHDPFDPRGVDPGAWRLVPLILSAGPDGIYDISFNARNKQDMLTGTQVRNYYFNGDPYYRFIGLPADMDNTSVTATEAANGQLNHYDNIHNHQAQD